VEQKLSPNSLAIKIYGVTSDTDWMTTPPAPTSETQSNGAASMLDPIDHLDWKQPSDGQYEVVAHLKTGRQWGYRVYYEGTTLCLDVKRAVSLKDGASRLSGIKVCVDPGHGGDEPGSIGCSGIRESQINLDMASKLKDLLEKEGATVTMTRT